MKTYGIITGDMVDSQAVDPQLRQQLYTATEAWLQKLQPQWISQYETYRGDSLQCSVKIPEQSLRIALMIRCFFKAYIPKTTGKITTRSKKYKSAKGYFTTAFDIRLAIGIGDVDFIQPGKISTSDGQAFRLSGEGLDGLKKESHRMVVKTTHAHFDEALEPSILLLDALLQKWTQNGAEVVLYKLQNKKDEEIASLLGISQSAVNQRKKNAQWPAVEKLIAFFEKSVLSWNE